MYSAPKHDHDFVEVNGARISYDMAGHGRPLVLIHAGIADARMWDDHFEVFAQHFTVIRYDVRGFGLSRMPAGTYSDRNDLFELLRALDVRKVSFLGVSMGAMIALDFALEHPEAVDALVLTSPALGGAKPSELSQQQDAAIDAVYESGDLAGAVELELRRWVDGPHRTPEMVDGAVRDRMREMDMHNFDLAGDDGVEIPLEPPAVGRLAQIHVPTLIIVGDGDVSDTLQNADTMVASIAGARKEVVRDAAHMVSMERKEEFNRLVLDFLNAL